MIRIDNGYDEPRIAALYDEFNPAGPDFEFYVRLADETPSSDIVDVGCGTGLLGAMFIENGHRVTGIEPAAAMLAIAKRRPGGERGRWILGTSADLAASSADLAVMTSNVSQQFVTEEAWRDNLTAIHAALRPSGRLAFDIRNPLSRAWENWGPEDSHSEFDLPEFGRVESWNDTPTMTGDLVSFDSHTVFHATGEHLVCVERLRFPGYDDVVASVSDSGFHIDDVFGDWNRTPFEPSHRFMVVVATRR